MRAEDLRIGNLVWEDYSGEMIVFGLVTGGINPRVELRKNEMLPAGSYYVDTLKGVELSSKWLERLGFHEKPAAFDNSSNPYWAKEGVILLYTETPPENTYLPCIGFTHEGKYLVAKAKEWITTVHELQNFYKSITGQDLTLTP